MPFWPPSILYLQSSLLLTFFFHFSVFAFSLFHLFFLVSLIHHHTPFLLFFNRKSVCFSFLDPVIALTTCSCRSIWNVPLSFSDGAGLRGSPYIWGGAAAHGAADTGTLSSPLPHERRCGWEGRLWSPHLCQQSVHPPLLLPLRNHPRLQRTDGQCSLYSVFVWNMIKLMIRHFSFSWIWWEDWHQCHICIVNMKVQTPAS